MLVVATLRERLRVVRAKLPQWDAGGNVLGGSSFTPGFQHALVSSEEIFPGPPTVLEFVDGHAGYARCATRAVRTLRSLRAARACHHQQFCQMRGYALRQEAFYAHHSYPTREHFDFAATELRRLRWLNITFDSAFESLRRVALEEGAPPCP